MSDFKTLRQDPKKYIEAFKNFDRMGATIGSRLISISATECVNEYTVNPDHFNPNKILHGGALYTVMDSSQGAFVHFILDDQFRFAATGTATIRYEAPVLSGVVQIITTLKEIQGRKIFVKSEAFNENQKLLATLDEVWIAVQ